MKKVFFVAMLALGLGKVVAQSSYGVTAGFHNFTIKASNGPITASTDASGFYAGFFGDFSVSDNINIQPEIHFVSTFKSGDSVQQLVVPVLAKYYFSDEFNVQAGPQFDFVLSDTVNINDFGLGIAFGAGYDFTEKVFATARYSFGLTDRIENGPAGVSSKFDTLQIGLGYRF